MDIAPYKDQFLKNGYVKIKKILNNSELESLKAESVKIMDSKTPIPWNNYPEYKKNAPEGESACFSDGNNMTVCTNITGKSLLLVPPPLNSLNKG